MGLQISIMGLQISIMGHNGRGFGWFLYVSLTEKFFFDLMLSELAGRLEKKGEKV